MPRSTKTSSARPKPIPVSPASEQPPTEPASQTKSPEVASSEVPDKDEEEILEPRERIRAEVQKALKTKLGGLEASSNC